MRTIDERFLEAQGRTMHATLLILATSFLFFSYISRFGYGVLLPRIVEEMKLSRAEAGLAFSFYVFFYSLLSIVSGRLFDRFGIKIVSLLCIVHGIGMVLVGFSNNLFLLILSLSIAGLGASSSWTPMVALVSSNLPASWRGRSTGILEAGIRTSHGAVGLVIPPIALAMGWRAVWWIFSIFLFTYALVFHLLSRKKGELRVDVERRELASYREVVRSRSFWLVGSSYSFMAFASYIFLAFFVDFLEREVKLPYVEASAMISIMGFMGIAGAVLLSWLSDRMGRRIVLIIANGVLSVNLALFSLLPFNELLIRILPLLMVVYGVFFGSVWPLYATCASDIFPSSVGTVLGMWTFMLGLSSLASPVIGGAIADITGSYTIALELGAITYLVALALITIGLTTKIDGTRCN
ncbi:MAG: MFS transporter [Candidatus Nezhaarchaeota archaeon]|nr:MFS transporter [Candidatus Nezhaarchaeota archaeon]